jgi:hypothetical protein
MKYAFPVKITVRHPDVLFLLSGRCNPVLLAGETAILLSVIGIGMALIRCISPFFILQSAVFISTGDTFI